MSETLTLPESDHSIQLSAGVAPAELVLDLRDHPEPAAEAHHEHERKDASFLELEAQAQDVLATLNRRGHTRTHNLAETISTYVEQEPNPQKQQLATILALAGDFAKNSLLKDELEDKKQPVPPELMDAIGQDHFDLVKYLDTNIDSIGMTAFRKWYGAAAGKEGWAERILMGASGEVALLRLLKGIEPRTRYANPQEDARGKDIITHMRDDGTLFEVGIDAKVHPRLTEEEEYRPRYATREGRVLHFNYGIDKADIDDNCNIRPSARLRHYQRLSHIDLSPSSNRVVA